MGLTIGVDVGGTKVLGGVVTDSGEVLKTARKDTPREGGKALTQTIADVAKELMQEYTVDSVGVCAAGFVSSDRKTMLATPNIADWNGVNLDYELTSLIGVPVVIENDANAAAWGEVKFGAARGKENVLMITVGTGIGGGIIANGRLHRGAFGIAAEVGHMRVVPDGIKCGCGAYGCFEQYGSGNALVRFAREYAEADSAAGAHLLSLGDGTIQGITGGAITSAAAEGDSLSLKAFSTLGNWLGAGIASLSVVLDPECVVIGGGVIDAGDILLSPIRDGLEKYMPFAGLHPYPQVIPALLGNDAGLVGAADLARV
jgi:glucokinase